MRNVDLFTQMLPLMMAQIRAAQREFGQLLSGTRNIVKHPNPETRKELQDGVDRAVQGLLVVYLFAMWEEFVSRDMEQEWLTPDELTKLGAFRHIRHSVAHGFEGKRAKQCRSEFEQQMNTKPFPNLEWDDERVDLSKSQVAIDCLTFMSDIGQKLIGRIANDNKP